MASGMITSNKDAQILSRLVHTYGVCGVMTALTSICSRYENPSTQVSNQAEWTEITEILAHASSKIDDIYSRPNTG